jgi:H+/Cl- antiporter ClcA
MQSIIDQGRGVLPHVWPKDQAFAYDLQKAGPNLLVAAAKMVAISITIHGGFRGGFIFPFFLTGR